MSRSGRVIKHKRVDDNIIASPRPVSQYEGDGDRSVASSATKIKKNGKPKPEAFDKVNSPKLSVVNPQKPEERGIKTAQKKPRKMEAKVR